MVAKKSKKVGKKVKTLPAKSLTAGQAKGVKGGFYGKYSDIELKRG